MSDETDELDALAKDIVLRLVAECRGPAAATYVLAEAFGIIDYEYRFKDKTVDDIMEIIEARLRRNDPSDDRPH